LSFKIEAGKTTALVGKSGCGKSTVTKLILRFYDPKEGSVLVNGVNLKDLHLLSFRRLVGIVSQETQLFSMSVADNIAYGLDNVSIEEVKRAAQQANADEFIRKLPEGYSTKCGEGGHDFSGGQRQRMSIARALVRNPTLLLLDEATSALDAENEAVVQEALDQMMKQMAGRCTIAVIAHRLSTIREANRIIVLHDGRLVEQGTHEELLERPEGRYAELVRRQLAGSGKKEDEGDEKEEAAADKKERRREDEVRAVEEEIKQLMATLSSQEKSQVVRNFMMAGKGKG